MKKLLFISLFFSFSLLSAMSINSIKNVYSVDEQINIRVNNLNVAPKNWLALYKRDASNAWANVLQWKWTENTVTGNFIFQGLESGEYQARVFYNNSYTVENSSNFSVSVNPPAEIKTRKKILKTDEDVWVQVNNIFGDQQDWVALYPKGSSNEWKNVIQWKFLEGKKNTEVKFNPLPSGEYEARVFFKNSYKLEAQYSFTVNNYKPSLPIAPIHTTEEIISIQNFKGFSENRKDWVGIYRKGTDNSWKNVVAWIWIDDAISKYYLGFGKLPVGEYEARGFFNNSYNTEVVTAFKVIDFSIDKNELIEKAKTTCLGQDKSTNHTLCDDDLNHVYLLTQRALNNYTYWGHYRVSLIDNNVKIIEEKTLEPFEQQQGLVSRRFHNKIEGTSIYIINNAMNGADEHGVHSFYSKEGTLLLNLSWYESEGTILGDTIKILDNSRKLYLERTFRNNETRYKETYDISDPNKMTLLNREIVPMPF